MGLLTSLVLFCRLGTQRMLLAFRVLVCMFADLVGVGGTVCDLQQRHHSKIHC